MSMCIHLFVSIYLYVCVIEMEKSECMFMCMSVCERASGSAREREIGKKSAVTDVYVVETAIQSAKSYSKERITR